MGWTFPHNIRPTKIGTKKQKSLGGEIYVGRNQKE